MGPTMGIGAYLQMLGLNCEEILLSNRSLRACRAANKNACDDSLDEIPNAHEVRRAAP